MDDALEAQIRRLWGGERGAPRQHMDDLRSEMIRTVSAAASMAEHQVDRLDKITLPLVTLNEYAQRSDATAAAWQFLDQIGSDYRRVSPARDLREVEEWRKSYEGAVALRDADVPNLSVGVLAVGELLDTHQPVQTLTSWIADGNVLAASMDDYTSAFGLVLGPIVQFALSPGFYYEARPLWATDLDSRAGYDWMNTFIAAGAQWLRNAERAAALGGQDAAAARARAR
jgi:hypothetical protein